MTTQVTTQPSDETAGSEKVTIKIDGAPGDLFTIRGGPFGDAKGGVTLAGLPARVTSWTDGRIKGVFPKGNGDAEIVVIRADGRQLKTWLWARSAYVESK